MQKVLIIGARGMIGHQVYRRFEKEKTFELFNIVHDVLLNEQSIMMDLRNESILDKVLTEIQPDYVINCAGVLISSAEEDLENAVFLNAYLPHHLKKIGDKLDFKLIHISTDCVFSGKKGHYSETDLPDGTSHYARTKGLGEINDNRHVTLRTSVIGPELKTNGHELFHWFMMQSGEIDGYTSAIWSGVTTPVLAEAVLSAINNGVSGIHNVTSGIPISKYDLLCLIKDATGKDIVIKSIPGRVTNKTLIDNRKELGFGIPSYKDMVYDLIELMNNEPSLYTQYRVK